MTLPFWLSDAVLLVVQASLVALPRPGAFARLTRLRHPAWAIIPVASIVGAVFGIRAAAGTAHGLSWLALVAVPPLAAVALGWVVRGARPLLAPLAGGLLALAWLDQKGLAGEGAGVALAALSSVTLGALLAAVAPLSWLKVGIVLMAVADATLVTIQLLGPTAVVLNAARPAPGLPQLQRELFGSAVLGYGDVFIAGTLGAIVAAERGPQLRMALLTLLLAGAFDLLFLAVDLLPATVPVALALVIREAARRRRPRPLCDASAVPARDRPMRR